MHIRILILILIYFFNLSFANSKEINVLFIGNSIIERNNLDSLLIQLAQENKRKLSVHKIIKGGVTVEQNLKSHFVNRSKKFNNIEKNWWKFSKNRKELKKVISSYDYILLQGRALEDENFPDIIDCLYTTKKKSCRLAVIQNNSFILWNDSLSYTELIESKAFFIQKVQVKYQLICVGDIFYKNYYKGEQLELLTDDNHPTEIGSIVMATMIYIDIFKSKPDNIKGICENKGITVNQIESLILETPIRIK